MNEINNEILKQQVQLQRLITSLLSESVYPALKDNKVAIRALLLDAEELTSITQINRITSEVTKLITANSTASWTTVTAGLQEFTEYELTQLAYSFAAAGYTVNAVDDIHNYTAKALMSLEGKNPVTGVWADFVKGNVKGQAEVINNQIKQAFVQGDTIKQTITRINQAMDGIVLNRVDNLARTGGSHYSAMARKAFAEDNSDIIDREYPMVTFDSRLSPTCAGIGSQYGDKGWPVGKSPIGYPPYHPNCRTTIAMRLKGEKESPVNDVNEWLGNQSKEFQDDVLGPTRAKAFRDGVKLDKFTDMTQRPLTIDELKSRDIVKVE